MRRVCLALLLWSLALGTTSAWAWSLQPVDSVPPAVAAQLPSTDDDQPGRKFRHYYLLSASGDVVARQSLVLERDRGQRLWLCSPSGSLLRDLPFGAAPPPASFGVRGAVLNLDFAAVRSRLAANGGGRRLVQRRQSGRTSADAGSAPLGVVRMHVAGLWLGGCARRPRAG